MKFGLAFANSGLNALPANAAHLARTAEAVGFESLWTVEHPVIPTGYQSTYPYNPSGRIPGGEDFDIPDPLVWLAFVAAHTTTIRLATGILILPMRNMLITAKEVATLDQLSGGRVTLGIGVGWLEEEFDALGAPFRDRGRRTDEMVAAMRAVWSGRASFSGDLISFAEVISLPVPPQGQVPIVIGGHTEAAARRAGRIGDGFFPGKGDLALLTHLVDVMRSAARDANRDPDAIELTTMASMDLDAMARLAELGFSRFVTAPRGRTPEEIADNLHRFADKVIVQAP